MHKKIESLIGRFGSFIYENPLKIIVVILVLLAFPISHLKDMKMDTSTEGYMHEDDPVLINYNKFKKQFGDDERIILAINNDNIFSIEFLRKLKKIHKELESKVPYIEDIISLYNVRNTRGEGDKLFTNDLLKEFPKTEEDALKIKEYAMNSEFYRDLLISQNGKVTAILLETDIFSSQGIENSFVDNDLSKGFEEKTQNSKFLTDEEKIETQKIIYDIVEKYKLEGLDISISGSPIIAGELKSQMRSDMQKFMRITFLLILIFLFVIFKRLSAVIYPLIVILFSLLSTLGFMAWSGVAFKIPSQILPSLIWAISIGATVHILSIFFDRFNSSDNKKESLIYALEHSGLAIIMTSITTAIGIGSFSNSSVSPISDLGVFAALGVIISLILTLTLLPALLSITKLKAKPKKEIGRIDLFMKKIAYIPLKYTKTIFVGSAIVILISGIASLQVNLSYNPLLWFKADNITRTSTEAIDKKMNGTVTIEVEIDTDKENGWIDPIKLEKLNQLTSKLENYKDEYTYIGKVVSLATIVKEINQALHGNEYKYYTIPKDAKLVSQELLLFENSGSDDLEDFIDSQFSKTRITIKIPWTDAIKAIAVLRYVESEVKKEFSEEKVNITGMVPLIFNTFSNAVYSSAQSYVLAFIVITFMMMFIFGSIRLGLISMIPNLTPIVMGLFLMYLFKIPLDMFTLLIGSIAIGLTVDDTIHFIHNFKRYYLQKSEIKYAIEETFFTTGKAMLITTLILSFAFYSYLAASMVSVENFGLLTGSVIIFALLSDLLLAPALIDVVT